MRLRKRLLYCDLLSDDYSGLYICDNLFSLCTFTDLPNLPTYLPTRTHTMHITHTSVPKSFRIIICCIIFASCTFSLLTFCDYLLTIHPGTYLLHALTTTLIPPHLALLFPLNRIHKPYLIYISHAHTAHTHTIM